MNTPAWRAKGIERSDVDQSCHNLFSDIVTVLRDSCGSVRRRRPEFPSVSLAATSPDRVGIEEAGFQESDRKVAKPIRESDCSSYTTEQKLIRKVYALRSDEFGKLRTSCDLCNPIVRGM